MQKLLNSINKMYTNTVSDIQSILSNIYEEVKDNKTGKVADYIPQLSKVSPDNFGISICTIDGCAFDVGDSDKYFCLQSCSKPISYCYARKLHGLNKVHQHVGHEPSGSGFNTHMLNKNNIPHNPMVNAGAIMISYLLNTDDEPADRFDKVKQLFKKLCGNRDVNFGATVYLSEKEHCDRNIALAYYMRESGSYGSKKPSISTINATLDMYFQLCSMEITTSMGAVIASTLANGGICPTTGERIFDTETVRDCLSLMYSCGMYDFSGQFAFEIGLPAKSGVSGCILLVIPGKMGVCVWSPPLDSIGNSVRGLDVCRKLCKSGYFDFHMFRNVGKESNVDNPDVLFALFMNATKNNDIKFINAYIKNIDINKSDYDRRTPLHVACSEGNEHLIKLFVEHGSDINFQDRWLHTPKDDLLRYMDEHPQNKEKINELVSIL